LCPSSLLLSGFFGSRLVIGFDDSQRVRSHRRVASPPRGYLALVEFTVVSSLLLSPFPTPLSPTSPPRFPPPHTCAHVCPFRRVSAVHILARTVPYMRARCAYDRIQARAGSLLPPTPVYMYVRARARVCARVCDVCLGCTWRLSGAVWWTGGWLVWAGGR